MICSLANINKFIKQIESKISDMGSQNVIILLRGDLASGKTTLVKKYVEFLKLDANVTSPTFSLQVSYNDFIFHYDLYNKGLDDFIALGMLEEFEKDGLHFVEWGDHNLENLLDSYGYKVIVIEIKKSKNTREYIIA